MQWRFIGIDPRDADVHISTFGMAVATNVVPLTHHRVLESGEMARLHLVRLEGIQVEPIHQIHQYANAVDKPHICGRCMEGSTHAKANTTDDVKPLPDLIFDGHPQVIQSKWQHLDLPTHSCAKNATQAYPASPNTIICAFVA